MFIPMKRLLFFALLAAICTPAFVAAQSLRTANGTALLNLVKNTADINTFRRAHKKGLSGTSKDYIVLSFPHILSQEERSNVEALGFELLNWLPDNAYIAATADADKALKKWTANIVQPDGIGEVPIALKLSKELYPYVLHGKAFPANLSRHGIAITVYQKNELETLQAFLKSNKIGWGRGKYSSANTIVVQSPSIKGIAKIAALSCVEAIAPYAGSPKPEWAYKMFANQTFAANYNVGGPIGTGTYFGNYETYGDDTLFDFNFKGRQHPTLSDNSVNDHGTSCTEIVGAANNRDEYEDRGMAPGVTTMYLGWYTAVENNYNNNNIKPLTSNHSVGWSSGQVTYNNDAKELDRITRTLGGYLHSYSAGNDGASGPYNGYPAGWANLTGDIKVNKNNFTTHSAAAPGSHYTWTNNGPAADGRLKPDVCAEGGEGSSFASPGVMGLCNILYESYTSSYGTFPRSDVVKAVILNTATDLDKKGIDFKTGFGVINPVRANRSIQQQHVFTGSMPAGSAGTVTYTVAVAAGLREARILLYWHDYQGTVGAVKALVNDLDLIVLSPIGDTIRPWCLNPTPATVYDLPIRRKDTLNNVEQVTIDNPIAGNYTVIVKGPVVPQGPQPFVVTYDLLPYHIEVTSPVANFRTARGKSLYFTWNLANNQTNAADSIQVFLQRISTEAFTQVASLPNNGLYYEYVVPAAFPFSSSARIIVKQKNTTLVDTSKLFHVMATPDNLAFTKICTDTLSIKWDTVNNVGGKYILYRLGAKYMVAIDSVNHPINTRKLAAATILGVGQQWVDGEWFAVAARQANGALSLRSLPITQQSTNPLNPTYIQQPLSYTLCYNDTAILSTGALTGDSVRWFMNNAWMASANASTLKRTMFDAGSYYYKVYNGSCVYTSGTYTIAPGNANIADTAIYGNYAWNISAYKGVGYATLPYYGTNPKYYGKFKLNDLGFNSNDYYNWYSTGPHNAPGYTGCSFTDAGTATTVWKRKGFVPGSYRINILRAAGKLNITVNNGTTSYYTTPANAFTINNVWSGALDSNSTIRIESYGSHTNIQLIALDTLSPGRITNGLAVWNKADMSLGSSSDKNTLVNAVPNGGAAEKLSTATIAQMPNGRNFNPTLTFNNSGGFQGRFPGIADSLYAGTATSTFGVFNLSSSSNSGARVMTFAGDATQDNNTATSFMPFAKNAATNQVVLMRNNVSLAAGNLTTDKWLFMTSKYNGNQDSISLNATLANSAAYTAAAFNLKRYAVGGYLDATTGGNANGSIAELIHYNRAVSGLEEQQINTYLAVKYGITLPHNYINTLGQVVFNNAAPYNKNIAGIGKESREGLQQKQSRSQEAIADIFTGSLGAIQQTNAANANAFTADSTYAIWANNNNDTLLSTTIGATGYTRMNRIWQLQKTSKVGTFRCNFNKSALPDMSVTSCSQYYLATSDEPTFTSANATFTSLAQYTGGDNVPYAFADWSLSTAGNATLYFTVAKKDATSKALATGSNLTTLTTCQTTDTISIKDNADNKIVAKVYKTTGTALPTIQSVNYATNRTDAQLANCNATQSTALLNRILQLTGTLATGSTMNLRIYMLTTDSANAKNNTWIATNGCRPLSGSIKWFKETSAADAITKLTNMQALSTYVDVAYGTESGLSYVEFRNLTSFGAFGGALQGNATAVGTTATTNGISVYPNPMWEQLYVDYTAPTNGKVALSLYDATGKLLANSTKAVTAGKSTLSLNVSSYTPGSYLLKVEDGHEVHNFPVVKAAR